MARCKHEGVVCSRRGELYVAGNTLVGVYDRVYLNTALLLSCFGMTSYTLENDVGEQRNGCGVNDSEPLDPLFRTISAVRRKNVSIGGIQVAIHPNCHNVWIESFHTNPSLFLLSP